MAGLKLLTSDVFLKWHVSVSRSTKLIPLTMTFSHDSAWTSHNVVDRKYKLGLSVTDISHSSPWKPLLHTHTPRSRDTNLWMPWTHKIVYPDCRKRDNYVRSFLQDFKASNFQWGIINTKLNKILHWKSSKNIKYTVSI